MKAAILLLAATAASAANNAKSFTPDSVRMPIRSVYISGEDHSITSTLYECAFSNERDCMVDLTDKAALKTLFGNDSALKIGEYGRISFSTCKEEGVYHAEVRGTVEINGQLYYTSAGANPLSPNPNELGYVTLLFHGCQRDYDLPVKHSVGENTVLDVSLFVPLRNIAWATLGPGPIPEGCAQNFFGTLSVCMGYPDPVPYIGKAEPVSETYSIYEPPAAPETAGGQVILLFDAATDGFIGGATRRFFSETSITGSANYDTPIRISEKNADGTFHFENYGSTGQTSYMSFPAFRRLDHFGKFINYNWGGALFDYGAYRFY